MTIKPRRKVPHRGNMSPCDVCLGTDKNLLNKLQLFLMRGKSTNKSNVSRDANALNRRRKGWYLAMQYEDVSQMWLCVSVREHSCHTIGIRKLHNRIMPYVLIRILWEPRRRVLCIHGTQWSWYVGYGRYVGTMFWFWFVRQIRWSFVTRTRAFGGPSPYVSDRLSLRSIYSFSCGVKMQQTLSTGALRPITGNAF